MGNQQNLSLRVAERVFEAVFPSYGPIAPTGESICLASRGLGVRVPLGPRLLIEWLLSRQNPRWL